MSDVVVTGLLPTTEGSIKTVVEIAKEEADEKGSEDSQKSVKEVGEDLKRYELIPGVITVMGKEDAGKLKDVLQQAIGILGGQTSVDNKNDENKNSDGDEDKVKDSEKNEDDDKTDGDDEKEDLGAEERKKILLKIIENSDGDIKVVHSQDPHLCGAPLLKIADPVRQTIVFEVNMQLAPVVQKSEKMEREIAELQAQQQQLIQLFGAVFRNAVIPDDLVERAVNAVIQNLIGQGAEDNVEARNQDNGINIVARIEKKEDAAINNAEKGSEGALEKDGMAIGAQEAKVDEEKSNRRENDTVDGGEDDEEGEKWWEDTSEENEKEVELGEPSEKRAREELPPSHPDGYSLSQIPGPFPFPAYSQAPWDPNFLFFNPYWQHSVNWPN